MSLDFSIQDNSLIVKFWGRTNNFAGIISVLKANRCTYNPDTKEWTVSPKKYHEIYNSLCEVETIVSPPEVEDFVRKSMIPHTGIRRYRSGLDKEELKVPPFKGKPPFEDFQYDDILELISRNRFALFNEQGTGKSYELISALDYYRREKKIGKVLVITSNSGVYNIKKEFEKFSDFDMSRVAIAGVKNREPFKDDIDIVICNYRSFLLISDHAYYLTNPSKKPPKKADREDDEKVKLDYRKCPLPLRSWIGDKDAALILDESHYIANGKARQTKTLMLAAPFFEYRYLASGTPADKEEKFYTQLKIMDTSLVKHMSYQEWLEEYAYVGTRFSDYAIDHFRPEKIPELQGIVAENCVRRFSDEVLELPENSFYTFYVPFTDIQRDVYHTFVVDRLQRMQEEEGAIVADSIRNSFQYLILAIDNPKLLLNHEEKLHNPRLNQLITDFDFQKDHSKVEALRDLIDQHPDSKIIVWNSHPSVASELSLALKDYHPLVINGTSDVPRGMSLDQYKDSIVSEFQQKKKHRVLIAGLQVLNTAVTIVEANVQIIFDCNFNFVEYSQALKRIHRIGQRRQVHTYAIVIDESLDVARKKNLEDKDFLNKNFLTSRYLSQAQTAELFNMKGD